jgi:hypothetical protein
MAPWHEVEAARWQRQAARPPPQDPASWAGRRRRHSRAPGDLAASTSSLPPSVLLAGGGVGVVGADRFVVGHPASASSFPLRPELLRVVGDGRPTSPSPPRLDLHLPSATASPSSFLPRLPTTRGSQLPRGDARGEALHCCRTSSFVRRDGLHTGLFCRSATGTCWSQSYLPACCAPTQEHEQHLNHWRSYALTKVGHGPPSLTLTSLHIGCLLCIIATASL